MTALVTAALWEDLDRWRKACKARDSVSEGPTPPTTACFQFGDILIQVDTTEVSLIDELMRDYSECARTRAECQELPRLRCSVCRSSEGLISISVRYSNALDLSDLALSLLNPNRRFHEAAVTDEAISGWRLFGIQSETLQRPFLVDRGRECLIDPDQLPEWFFPVYVVALAQSAQKHVVFLHAASVSIRGHGLLLIGDNHSGKTTTSLTLACRKHALFGDNIAGVRMDSLEILPFRRIARIRQGPRAMALNEIINRRECSWVPIGDGTVRIHAQPRDFFPEPASGPVPLTAAFFLSGFGDRPKVERFVPQVQDLTMFRSFPVCWGASAGQRLMRLMSLQKIFSKIECRRLIVGPPEETADLVEMTMEEVWA